MRQGRPTGGLSDFTRGMPGKLKKAAQPDDVAMKHDPLAYAKKVVARQKALKRVRADKTGTPDVADLGDFSNAFNSMKKEEAAPKCEGFARRYNDLVAGKKAFLKRGPGFSTHGGIRRGPNGKFSKAVEDAIRRSMPSKSQALGPNSLRRRRRLQA